MLDQAAEALTDDLADVRIRAGGIRLHLRQQHRRVLADQLAVRLPDRLERVLAALPGRRVLEDPKRLVEALPRRREVELLLRPEEAEQVRLRDPRAACDCIRRSAVEPAEGELLTRGPEELLTPFLGGLALCGCCGHG